MEKTIIGKNAMTIEKVIEVFDSFHDEENVGANRQPSFDIIRNAVIWMAQDMIDVQFPCYDAIFIRFKLKVNAIEMARLVHALGADEVHLAESDDLNYIEPGTVSSKCRENITKYVRFWWD